MVTNFAGLTTKQKLVWSRDVWEAARDKMFIKKFVGSGEGSMIQRITELTKTEKGEQCIMFLVADLVGDGVVGDNEREGMEEDMQSYEQIISIDLISHGVKNKGKMSEQKTVIKFREHAKDKLSYWLANRLDQLAFLTLSGIGYNYMCNGALRASTAFSSLAFASNVSAPSSKRSLMWNGSSLAVSSTGNITTSYLPSYKMITALVAYAKDHYIKPLMSGGKEYYVLLVKPGTLAALKNDADYKNAVINAAPSGKDNPFFTGATVTLDGVVIHEHNLVYSTTGTSTKWGAGNAIEGTRSLFCGAQALGMADLGQPEWDEKTFQYGSQTGINVDKMFGFLKPKFHSIYDGSEQDFGVIAVDHHLPM
jgi:N4-gp56 family major capsid protein